MGDWSHMRYLQGNLKVCKTLHFLSCCWLHPGAWQTIKEKNVISQLCKFLLMPLLSVWLPSLPPHPLLPSVLSGNTRAVRYY